MKTSEVQSTGQRSISAAKKELLHQDIILYVCFLIPPVVITAVLWALNHFQEKLYGVNEKTQQVNNWYDDPFTVVIVSLFIFGQVLGLLQYFQYFIKAKAVSKLAKAIDAKKEISNEEHLNELSETIQKGAPASDEKHLILNWLDARTKSRRSSSTELTDSAFNRHELKREKTAYLHILINRMTLKLGFLGTLIGLLMTFPAMQGAMRNLAESDGEMKFISDIVDAIKGDQYAILTTMLATFLSIIAEFITIQLITRLSINFELIMGYFSDWYHSTIVPIFEDKSLDETLAKQKKEAEQAISENLVTLTALSKQTAVQLEQMTQFQTKLAKRVNELDSYEQHYRQMLATKAKAMAPAQLVPNGGHGEA